MIARIRIGTRGSTLALYQAELVGFQIKQLYPSVHIDFVKIKTEGDQSLGTSIGKIGPGAFTREIEHALLKNQIDIGVHSAKDMATDLPSGLTIAAALEREDARDCLVTACGVKLQELKKGARLGTSSLRRKAQIAKIRPDLVLADIRGNVDTRIRKIESGEYDGMVIALAGLKRLKCTGQVTEIFDPHVFIPQAGQGIIAIETRAQDEVNEVMKKLNHEPSMISLLAERSFLRTLEGGCLVPAGVHSEIKGNHIFLKGGIFSVDGTRSVVQSKSGTIAEGEKIAKALAETVLELGGGEILKALRYGA